MQRVPVVSSDIASVGYNERTRVLEVEFIKSGVYSYYNVEPYMFAAFLGADSKGQFFNRHIKQGPYPFEKGEDVNFENL